MEVKHGSSQNLEAEGVFVSLTHSILDVVPTIAQVRSPKAGAIVLFAGTDTESVWQSMSA